MDRHKLAAAALLGLTACAVVACGNSSSPTAGGHPAPAIPDTPAGGPSAVSSASSTASTSQCSVTSSALVGKALGLPVGKVIPSVEGPVTVCAYAGRNEVLIRYQTGETAAEFAQGKSSQQGLHQTVAAVGGLGDGAYSATDSAGRSQLYTLAARSGDIAVFITSPAPLSAERSLMTKLLAKV
ncbi:MAG: hypothetical protein ACRDN0_25175 [Trebonia sp.]